jgi:UDP-N-acetylmuramate dehydrogenase
MLKKYPLKPFNTFGITAFADFFSEIRTAEDLSALPDEILREAYILGGGSNVLLTGDVKKPVLKMSLRGTSIIEEDDEKVIISAKAGEIWHDFVMMTVEKSWGGLENLSLIPGTVGAAPIQNIGAYGVEIKDRMAFLVAFDRKNKVFVRFENKDCRFAYRDSLFKSIEKNRYIITEVAFQLSKKKHDLRTDYGAVRQILEKKNLSELTPKDISEAVIAVRQSKLPDPKDIGNCGSFFKNPEVSREKFTELKEKFPELIAYPTETGFKLAAGWLIERCGFKGKRAGNVGTYKEQALVIVNYGDAKGTEVAAFAESIRSAVFEVFGVALETEVNYW